MELDLSGKRWGLLQASSLRVLLAKNAKNAGETQLFRKTLFYPDGKIEKKMEKKMKYILNFDLEIVGTLHVSRERRRTKTESTYQTLIAAQNKN